MERGMKKIEKKRWISKGVKEKSGKFLEIPGAISNTQHFCLEKPNFDMIDLFLY